ncbi:hypothetical protein [Marinagarivorans algicola]|uniref:hypothetical protein n=1 Tax=Marinagarivorans algicola TaxID=1513270 RepID=UPI0006B4C9C1|nr:hypothetical protein [Marinagarivorans algicola]
MHTPQAINDPKLFAGLTALAESSFPKTCNTCGRNYPDVESFISQTQGLIGHSGLKASTGDTGAPLVELFRNCVCGSTLLDLFNDRRDISNEGIERRLRFDQLLRYLEARNIPRLQARSEILKVLHGEGSKLLSQLPPSE